MMSIHEIVNELLVSKGFDKRRLSYGRDPFEGINALHDKDRIVYEVDVPGCHGSNIDIETCEDENIPHLHLTIKRPEPVLGEAQMAHKGVDYRTREMLLPLHDDSDAEQVTAEIKGGVLRITIKHVPEEESTKQKRRVPITTHDA